MEIVRWRVNLGFGSEAASDATIEPYAFFVGTINPNSNHPADEAAPPPCKNGAVEKQACPSGYTGSGRIRECTNGVWAITDNNCSKSKPGQPPPNAK